ncbi:MAG: ACP S-malonyltransferase [Rubrobacter sp.]|nr:ACP S-malonyltransferase [Rubrobacter sp.]
MAIRRGVVFPGQGSRGGEVSGEVEEALRRVAGEGETPYQLSVFASSVELFHRLRERGVEPDVVAGHSLGEYTAAYAAGALSLEDGMRLVAERDRLMMAASREHPGGMTALVGAGLREVTEAVAGISAADRVVVVANYNTPRQTVVSGEPEALEEVSGTVGGRKFELEVAGAFHSPLMAGAARGMDELLSQVELRDPEVPMVSATDGAVLAKADDVRLALRNQMLSPVRWVAVVERFAELGVEEIVEAGEDGTLVRMLRDFKEVGIEGRKAGELLS